MVKEADKWSNIRRYAKDDYLSDSDFSAIKAQVRRCWRIMGMLHLRMENDVDKRVKKKLPVPELIARLDEAENLIKAARGICEEKVKNDPPLG